MKKLIMAAIVVASLFTTAYANPTKVNYLALKNFTAEYQNASVISWTATAGFFKAVFTVENQKMEAFYNVDGEKIATSTGISVDQLPLKAKRAFAKKYENYNVKEAILFEGVEETAYFISAENETESLIVKMYDNGHDFVYRKIKK